MKGAWVTLATNDSYSLGALVLAHSLKQVGTTRELAILITPGVTNSMRTRLSQVFNLVQEVNVLDSRDQANLRLLQRPELGITFTKLHCWRLTQYEKCVFLDADTLVLQNCDELFDREELSAAPDVGWPDCFNSGVFVYRPSGETYDKLIQFALDKGSFDGGDQGLLNLYFSDWAHKDISKHLPFIYNVCSTAFYSYLPAFKQFGKDVKIIHFIGSAKPWLQYFDTETQKVRPSSDVGHLAVILQRWWDIFCSLIHPNLSPDMSGLAGAFAKLTLGQQRSPEQEALEDSLRRQNWEQGNIDYLGRDSFENIWNKICETLSKGPQESAVEDIQVASGPAAATQPEVTKEEKTSDAASTGVEIKAQPTQEPIKLPPQTAPVEVSSEEKIPALINAEIVTPVVPSETPSIPSELPVVTSAPAVTAAPTCNLPTPPSQTQPATGPPEKLEETPVVQKQAEVQTESPKVVEPATAVAAPEVLDTSLQTPTAFKQESVAPACDLSISASPVPLEPPSVPVPTATAEAPSSDLPSAGVIEPTISTKASEPAAVETPKISPEPSSCPVKPSVPPTPPLTPTPPEQTSSPIQTPTPAEQITTPSEQTPIPPQESPSPIEQITTLQKETQLPTPTEQTPISPEKIPTPLEKTIPPTEKNQTPVEKISTPPEKTSPPTEQQTPVQTSPVEISASQVKTATPLAQPTLELASAEPAKVSSAPAPPVSVPSPKEPVQVPAPIPVTNVEAEKVSTPVADTTSTQTKESAGKPATSSVSAQATPPPESSETCPIVPPPRKSGGNKKQGKSKK
ncbi:hypothetical protein HHI36_023552 [Cryptolaemus montrouzieri]|uniref:glycogenin glucosyltransferase n=1 Tax=Cryptolaemus montrouzieri TaxID=559131 RepID=A0ABD2PH94_9CUCU